MPPPRRPGLGLLLILVVAAGLIAALVLAGQTVGDVPPASTTTVTT